jgi:predicted nucleotide-binding protein (sugar kinase/HSP70/actin superfamily)
MGKNLTCSENKKLLPEIPPETCPLIDKIIDELKTNVPDIEDTECLFLMEEIRKHNSNLRHLGSEWYSFALKLEARLEEQEDSSEKEIKALEKEIKALEKENRELEIELNSRL